MQKPLLEANEVADSVGASCGAAPVGPDQVSLFGADAPPIDEGTHQPDVGRRVFFPANREDALILLGGLCLSSDVPDLDTRVPLANGYPAMLRDGLRSSEALLLCDGRQERFPVLAEIDVGVMTGDQRAIGFDQIVRLVFRNQDEADDFRYRPVDEFDPGKMEYRVEPGCFDLAGPPRFEIKRGLSGAGLSHGHLADRLTGALYSLVQLGESRSDCRHAVFEFLAGSVRSEGAVPTYAAVCEALRDRADQANLGQLRAVVQAFIDVDTPSPSELIERVAERLSTVLAGDERGQDTVARWVTIARDVARSRIALDGDLLADDKSVLLRGALLALMPEGVDDVVTYLDAEKPAGVKVVAFATFLIGLKVGALNTPWSSKATRARSLGALCRRLFLSFASGEAGEFGNVITTHLDKAVEEAVLEIKVGEDCLASWSVPSIRETDPIEDQWLDALLPQGYKVVRRCFGERSWVINDALGSSLEIKLGEVAGRSFPMFRYRLNHGKKLRKVSEIAAAFSTGGRLWSPRKDADGILSLCCELHALPDRKDFDWVFATLEIAKGLCIAPAKPARKRASTPKKKLAEH